MRHPLSQFLNPSATICAQIIVFGMVPNPEGQNTVLHEVHSADKPVFVSSDIEDVSAVDNVHARV
jgi:hypothetical protein